MIPVRVARRLRDAETWALVLSSQSIPSQLVKRPDGVAVTVDVEHIEGAESALDLYDRENQRRREPHAAPPDYGRTSLAFALSALLFAFFFVTGPPRLESLWFERGVASSDLILGGEVWRSVTALTLHADLAHVLGNVAGFAVFGTAVFRSFGPGLGALLVLGAGIAGNLLTALLHGASHHAVGFSTAVFAAVGILSGLQFSRARHLGLARAWLPLAAALALLAFLGMSEGADLLAHLLGLVAGVGVGVAAALTTPRPPRAPVQLVCGLGAGATLLGAWLLALR